MREGYPEPEEDGHRISSPPERKRRNILEILRVSSKPRIPGRRENLAQQQTDYYEKRYHSSGSQAETRPEKSRQQVSQGEV